MATNVPVVWTNSGWRQAGPAGSAARVAMLQAFCTELANWVKLQTDYQIKGRVVHPQFPEVKAMLAAANDQCEIEEERADLASGARLGWTQGFATDVTRRAPGTNSY